MFDVGVFFVVDLLKKHIVGAAPEASIAIERAVGNHLFLSFGMINYILKDIQIALEMAVDAVEFEMGTVGFWGIGAFWFIHMYIIPRCSVISRYFLPRT